MRKNAIAIVIAVMCVYVLLAFAIGAAIGSFEGTLQLAHLNGGNTFVDGENGPVLKDNADMGFALVPELSWIPWVGAFIITFLLLLIIENDYSRRQFRRIMCLFEEYTFANQKERTIFKEASIIVFDRFDGASESFNDYKSFRKAVSSKYSSSGAIMQLLHSAETCEHEKHKALKSISVCEEKYRSVLHSLPFSFFHRLAGLNDIDVSKDLLQKTSDTVAAA